MESRRWDEELSTTALEADSLAGVLMLPDLLCLRFRTPSDELLYLLCLRFR